MSMYHTQTPRDPFTDSPVEQKFGHRHTVRWPVLIMSVLGAVLLFICLVWQQPFLEILPHQIDPLLQQNEILLFSISGTKDGTPSVCGYALVQQQTVIEITQASCAANPKGGWIFTAAPPAAKNTDNCIFPFILINNTLYLGDVPFKAPDTADPAASDPPVVTTYNPPSPSPFFTPASPLSPSSAAFATVTPNNIPVQTEQTKLETTFPALQQPVSQGPDSNVIPSTAIAYSGAVTPAPVPTQSAVQPTPSSIYFSAFNPETRYYSHQLTAKEQLIFAAVYDGMMQFSEDIPFSPVCSEQELDHVMFVLYNDCPELMQLSMEYTKRFQDENEYFSISMQYNMDAVQYQTVMQQTLLAVEEMQNAPDFGKTDLSRELSIYRNIIERCTYTTDEPFCDRACGPLVYGYGKCDGYANALSFALRYYGIPSTLICGEGYQVDQPADAEDHCWNYVNIDQQWYQCDITWDDADSEEISAQADFLPCFNLTDERMLLGHTISPSLTAWLLPVCDSIDAYYYSNHGIFIKQSDDFTDVLTLALTQAYENQSDSIAIAFATQDAYLAASTMLQNAVRAWQDKRIRVLGFSYIYSNEGLVLYLYDLLFT